MTLLGIFIKVFVVAFAWFSALSWVLDPAYKTQWKIFVSACAALVTFFMLSSLR